MAKVPHVTFNNGKTYPIVGLGTWQGGPGKEGEVGQAVKDAIDLGYRHFDGAHIYANEKIIGDALQAKIKEGVVKREELFITSKLWNSFHKPELVEGAIRQTLKDLQLDYVDLYLIHWPFGYQDGGELSPLPVDSDGKLLLSDVDYVNTWKAMEEVYKKGLAKSIGISNFNSQQIERLLKTATVVPATNQVELHPYLNQKKLKKFCEERKITITSYSPLGSPGTVMTKPDEPYIIDDPKVKDIAKKYGKTPGQILLKWNVQSGNIVVPKSSNKQRLLDNLSLFDFELSSDDMKYIDTFNNNGRICTIDKAVHHKFYPFKPDIEF